MDEISDRINNDLQKQIDALHSEIIKLVKPNLFIFL